MGPNGKIVQNAKWGMYTKFPKFSFIRVHMPIVLLKQEVIVPAIEILAPNLWQVHCRDMGVANLE